MRRRDVPLMLCAATAFLLVAVAAPGRAIAAQDVGTLDQLKKMYDDALGQLKAAQDRKNELAKENEALAARVRELEAKVEASTTRLDDLNREAAVSAEKSFFLRSHYAAFQGFLARHPDLLGKWKLYLGDGLTVPRPPANASDAWPLAADETPVG